MSIIKKSITIIFGVISYVVKKRFINLILSWSVYNCPLCKSCYLSVKVVISQHQTAAVYLFRLHRVPDMMDFSLLLLIIGPTFLSRNMYPTVLYYNIKIKQMWLEITTK